MVSPSLKYALSNAKLFIAFEERIYSVNSKTEKLKKNLVNYKGNKIHADEEMKKLNEISNKLISIKKEAENIYEIYRAE